MSRRRRRVVSNRFFFITGRLLPHRRRLSEREFELLARVVRERRRKYHFLLTAWVLLPDHWHAIFFPPFPLTISSLREAIKSCPSIGYSSRRMIELVSDGKTRRRNGECESGEGPQSPNPRDSDALPAQTIAGQRSPPSAEANLAPVSDRGQMSTPLHCNTGMTGATRSRVPRWYCCTI